MLKLLFGLTLGLALTSSVCAEESDENAEKSVEYPSPDGGFAFLFLRPPEDRKTVDLIEKKSGKILRRIVESSEDFGDRLGANVLWMPDSRRFAITCMLNRRSEEISVYERSGHTFREVKLPKFPDPELPANAGDGKVTNINSVSATRWEKDGSLVVEITTVMSREKDVMTATRTLVLGFDKSGRAKILRSSHKVTTEAD